MQKHSVTSVLSKNHLDHLEANSVSVIPIDSKTSTNNSILNSNSIRQKPSPPRSVFHVQNMKHFQQQLETAAVLMDISKKVIISPPSSNPQSPCLSEQQQSITHSVIKVFILFYLII